MATATSVADAALPPPFRDGDLAVLQLANLTANYVSSVRRVLKISGRSHNDATARAFAAVRRSDALHTVQSL